MFRVLPYLVAFLAAMSSFGLLAQPFDYARPENVRRFAEALAQEGDYLRAAGEYQRYLFSQPPDADRILLQIALCYRLGGRQDRSLQFLQRLLREYPQSAFIDRAHYEIGFTYFLTGHYDRTFEYLERNRRSFRAPEIAWQSQQLMGLSLLMQKRWNSAIQLFETLDETGLPGDAQSQLARYLQLAREGAHLPRKSPLLAGTLSALLPGAGKVYARRARDGLFSLIVLSLAGWQAYDGFHRDGTRSVKGWIFGSVGAIFYLGNIYGSAVAAKVSNRTTEEALLQKVLAEFP